MMPSHPLPTRLFSLDALRGLAALGVVLFHHRHFFYDGPELGDIDTDRLPAFKLLFMIYSRGGLAVDLFFSLSGFVFYWLYSQRIHSGTISARSFAVMRISRLYPLHIVTLLAVALGQAWLTRHAGGPFVYIHNDAPHFTQNLLLVSAWGFQDGYSFNAPIWSVSIEMLLYIVFYITCCTLPLTRSTLLLGATAGFAFATDWDVHVGRGLGSFFLGGLLFHTCLRMRQSADLACTARLCTMFTAGLWIVTLQLFPQDEHQLAARLRSQWPVLESFAGLPHALEIALAYWPILVLFPATILSLVLLETSGVKWFAKLSWLGDISYSSYLLHFPLQLAMAIMMTQTGLSRDIAYSPAFLLAFFAVLIGLSLYSYHLFEMPAQRYLRRRLG
jgi:peptidoglycan/LPS O-acetylase OafA/YrhL